MDLMNCLIAVTLVALLAARLARRPGDVPSNLVLAMIGAAAALGLGERLGLSVHIGAVVIAGAAGTALSAAAGATVALALRYASPFPLR